MTHSKQPGSLRALGRMVLWSEWVQGLQKNNRYFATNDSYFRALVRACLACRTQLSELTPVYRGRIKPFEDDEPSRPLPLEKMGSPPHHLAVEHRLNPEGIAYFYAALEEETAIAEVRAWTGARLTVALFETLEPLSVLDLTGTETRVQPPDEVVWISRLLSRPVHRDDRWGYLGTQYLAERLKSSGLAGLLYPSAMKQGGTNIALFSERFVRGKDVGLREVLSVQYTTKLLPPPVEWPLPSG